MFGNSVLNIFVFKAVDRSLHSSISDARDAIVNVCVDVLSSYKATMSSGVSGLYAPSNLRLLPLYLAALLKSVIWLFYDLILHRATFFQKQHIHAKFMS